MILLSNNYFFKNIKNFILYLNINFIKIYFLDFFLIKNIIFTNLNILNFYNFYSFFLLNKFYYYYYLLVIFKNFKNFIVLLLKTQFLYYKFYRFFTFVGLGFRKKGSKWLFKNSFFLYFGHRHWVIFTLPPYMVFFYLLKRKSIVLFTKYKNILKYYTSNFKSFVVESIFKLKGVLDIHLRRRWVFMRRVKIRGLKIKLSKKQKFL